MMVPPVGLEPTHPCGYKILSLARLPIPPQGHSKTSRNIKVNSVWSIAHPCYEGQNYKGDTMAITQSDQLIFAATNAADNISEIKAASFRTLLAYSAGFAFMVTTKPEWSSQLQVFFKWGGVLAIILVAIVYPLKLRERRERLDIVFQQMLEVKRIRQQASQKVFGSTKEVNEEDWGDILYQLGGALYLAVLMILYFGKTHS